MSESLPRQPAPPRATGLSAAPQRLLAVLLVAGVLLFVATDVRAQDPFDANDPLEDVNRVTFEVNQTIDRFLLKPIAETYVFILPNEVRHRIANVLANLSEPLNLVNNAAQFKFERAGSTLMRFTLNSTVGVGGIFDVAGDLGYERAPEDFGQTLAAWGIGGEPFLMLPLLGPTNPRDAGAFVVDWIVDPYSYILPAEAGLARSVTSGVSQRAQYLEELETLEATSVDYYAALRELYRQYRATEIRDGAPPPAMEIPDFDFDDDFDEDFDEE
ncbi:MAG: VacJ family lipoprotein [Rhodospirillaceae bacterium]|nr:VacJ family lipoprotein [Rhodospirillaceae bacterium]